MTIFKSPLEKEFFWRKVNKVMKVCLSAAVAGLIIFGGGALIKKGRFQPPMPTDEVEKFGSGIVSKERKEEPSDQRVVLPVSRQVHRAVVAGDYDLAKKLLLENPDEASLKGWRSKLMDELEIDFRFWYLPGRGRPVVTKLSDGIATLTPEDPYYLRVHTSNWCYLYIFQVDSSGKLDQLFPNPKIPTPNPVPPGPLRIPDGPYRFYLDDVVGTEKIYLVASGWRNEELEEFSARLVAERDPALKRDLIEKILSRLRLEDEATDKLPGLAFGMYQFRHAAFSGS